MGKFYSKFLPCVKITQECLVITVTLEKPYGLSVCLSLNNAADVTKIDIQQACGTLKILYNGRGGGGGERAAPRLAFNEPVKRQVCPIVHGRGENPPALVQ